MNTSSMKPGITFITLYYLSSLLALSNCAPLVKARMILLRNRILIYFHALPLIGPNNPVTVCTALLLWL